jgi:endonuclease/exonuclease/phosphatase family metal-dependent hydrolase
MSPALPTIATIRPAALLGLALCTGCTGKPDSAADSGAESVPTEGELRILTYNVAGLPDGVSGAGAPLLERMPQIAARLDDYDLVGLQEDFDTAGHEALVGDAGHGTVRWFDTLVADDRLYGSGLSQLARPAIVAYEGEHYTGCNGVFDGASDCLASKGFQVLTLSLGGAELDFYNTHHEAGGGDEDEAVRLAQVQQVVASTEGRSAGRAIIYTGDFNLHPDDAEDIAPLAAYDNAGLLRTCDLLGCAEPNHIDQVRLRDGDDIELEAVAWARVEDMVDAAGEDLSDHPAVEVTIRWRRR